MIQSLEKSSGNVLPEKSFIKRVKKKRSVTANLGNGKKLPLFFPSRVFETAVPAKHIAGTIKKTY